MKFYSVLALILISVSASHAETMYISDAIQVNMRTGRGFQYKILAMINSGQVVEVIEREDQYAKIRIPNGREGWVESQYLTPNKPSRLLLESLEKKHSEILEKIETTQKENSTLRTENDRLNSELSAKEKAFSELTRGYETLKSDTADFPILKARFDEATSQLKEQRIRADKFEGEFQNLNLYQNIRWFLFGAGTLVFGMVLGFSTRRQRRTSSL
jgi:SH3 domain protein